MYNNVQENCIIPIRLNQLSIIVEDLFCVKINLSFTSL